MPTLAGTMDFLRSGIDVTAIKKELTLKYYDAIAEETVTIHAYKDSRLSLRVPREWGIDYCQKHGIVWKDATTAGTGTRDVSWSNAKKPKLRDYQVPWVDALHLAVTEEYDIRAQAGTGKGKTVMSLEVARRLDRATIVLVDQEFLRDQWKDTAQKLFGLRDDEIGFVQGKKCDYEGKLLVIAMVQTLHSREYDKSFYEYFGTVIFDEAHVVGAPVFSKTLMMFPASIRWGVSATPERGDKKDSLLEWNLGPVDVVLDSKHAQSVVRYIQSYSVYSWYSQISPKTGRYLNEIAADMNRNRMMAEHIAYLYRSGRTVLALSDRIEHLEVMKFLLGKFGVPAEDVGVIARFKRQWRYAKDPKPNRKPEGWDREAAFTPVKMQVVSKRAKTADLDQIKSTVPIMLATYQFFSKGVDVPRIDTGMDLTPRSKAQQQHGRILRELKGKMTPVWVTIRDINSFRGEHQFAQRLAEYAKSNVEVYEWRLNKGVKRRELQQLLREVRERNLILKQSKIVTRQDGRNTLTTQSLLKRPSSRQETTTVKRIRRKIAS